MTVTTRRRGRRVEVFVFDETVDNPRVRCQWRLAMGISATEIAFLLRRKFWRLRRLEFFTELNPGGRFHSGLRYFTGSIVVELRDHSCLQQVALKAITIKSAARVLHDILRSCDFAPHALILV